MFKITFKKDHKNHLLATIAVFALLILGTFYLFSQFLFFRGSYYSSTNLTENQRKARQQATEVDPFITKALNNDASDIVSPILNNIDPSIGPVAAKVNIVEFSKYDCDFCQKQENILRQAMKKYGAEVRLIRKDYPEKDIMSLSYQAAAAARCAAEQKKFWQYSDELYKLTDKGFIPAKFEQIAKNIGLNIDYFRSCLNSGRSRALINNNIDEGDSLGITGVPYIYINNEKITGEINVDDIENIIDKELSSSQN